MSGCYRNSPKDMSTEKYRMVKERRGGCQSRNGQKMNSRERERENDWVKAQLGVESAETSQQSEKERKTQELQKITK